MKTLSLLFMTVLSLGFAQDKAATTDATPAAKPEVPKVAEAPASALDGAIEQAKADKKMLFVKYGWERCGNCRNLDKMIESDAVSLPEDEFVVVNVSPVDAPERKKFEAYYKIRSGIYPRIVITDPEGTILGTRFGYGQAKQYNELVSSAKKKAASPAADIFKKALEAEADAGEAETTPADK